MIGVGAWAVSITIAPVVAQSENTIARDAERFGAREHIEHISLSPDGSQVAMVVPGSTGDGTIVQVANPIEGGAPRSVMRLDGANGRVISCAWPTDTRIICNIHLIVGPDRLSFTRVVSFNRDGSDVQLLSQRPGANALGLMQNGGRVLDLLNGTGNGAILMTRQYIPEGGSGTRMVESRRGLGVDRVDVVSGRRTVVEQPVRNLAEYISDGQGRIRVRGIFEERDGIIGRTLTYQYRPADGGSWRPLATYDLDDETGFNPLAVDPTSNMVYGLEKIDGRQALWRIALDGTGRREMVLSHPQVDISGVIQTGRNARIVGATYVTDRRQAEMFDPELKILNQSLGRALPNSPIVSFVGASADESSLLLFAGSDNDPGRYFLYKKSQRELIEVMPSRPQLEGVALARVQHVTFPAADGTQIPGYLTLPPGSDGRDLPAIVLPHGGPGSRDEWGFDWLSQFLAARGYVVLQPNFRGSTGYGDSWFQNNGFRSWRTAIGDVNDGGRWLISQGIADANRLAIMGWSYGGYAALQSAVLDPDLFKAIVAVAPVTDLEVLRSEARGFTNSARVDAFIGRGPHIAEGSPARHAERIRAPVMLVHGTLDQNVGVGQSRLMQRSLQTAGRNPVYLEFDGLDHYLVSNTARQRMLQDVDGFLAASMR
nr:S9 family peptidase [Sphingomonas jejuensis]